jgi:hypothetical protein
LFFWDPYIDQNKFKKMKKVKSKVKVMTLTWLDFMTCGTSLLLTFDFSRPVKKLGQRIVLQQLFCFWNKERCVTDQRTQYHYRYPYQ